MQEIVTISKQTAITLVKLCDACPNPQGWLGKLALGEAQRELMLALNSQAQTNPLLGAADA